MKIWKLVSDIENYNSLEPIGSADWDTLTFDGTFKGENWIPQAVKNIDEKKQSDFPGFIPSTPVFSQRAVELLNDFLEGNAEILPLRYRNGNYFTINIIKVLKCVAYENAEFKRYSSSGKIMLFTKYAFEQDLVKNQHIFKITDEPKRSPFVSDEFRNRVLKCDLKGFLFKLVWDS